jgi:hypothetical protein
LNFNFDFNSHVPPSEVEIVGEDKAIADEVARGAESILLPGKTDLATPTPKMWRCGCCILGKVSEVVVG